MDKYGIVRKRTQQILTNMVLTEAAGSLGPAATEETKNTLISNKKATETLQTSQQLPLNQRIRLAIFGNRPKAPQNKHLHHT